MLWTAFSHVYLKLFQRTIFVQFCIFSYVSGNSDIFIQYKVHGKLKEIWALDLPLKIPLHDGKSCKHPMFPQENESFARLSLYDLLCQCTQVYFPLFFSMRFSVAGFILRSLIHLDLSFMHGDIWVYFHSSTCSYPVMPTPFVKYAFFFHLSSFSS